jgi:glycosyltransferase involved in cell wall biosynthesis
MSKVSILIPTRKRFEMFKKSISSLYDNCSDINNFEVLVATDNDDDETTSKIKDFFSDKTNIKYFTYERKYYYGFHHYINDLSNKAKGEFLFLWGDDAVMKSKDWDLEILKHNGKFCMLSPKVDNMESYWRDQGVLFPIIPKKWVDITGVFSLSPSCDSWADVLSKKLGVFTNIGSVVLTHERYDLVGVNNDENFNDSREALQSSNYQHIDSNLMNMIEEHSNKIKEYLSI